MFEISTAGAAPTMTSQEIADLTEKQHGHVMRDIRAMLTELHGEDRLSSFGETVERPNPSGGAPILSPIFRLPKRETLILVSGYSLTLRSRIIDRWQELEQQALTGFMIPRTMPEALRLAAEAFEGKAAAEAKVLQLEHQTAEQAAALEDAAPKVAALERIARADGAICIQNAAKDLQMRHRARLPRPWSTGAASAHRRLDGGPAS